MSVVTASRAELDNMYSVEQLNTKDIAKIYNCNAGTVWYWLHRYGIPTRGRKTAMAVGEYKFGKKILLPIDKIIHLYTEDKMPLKRIGKTFGCSKWVISNRLKEAGVPRRTREIALTDYGRSVLWSPEMIKKRIAAKFKYWASISPERRSERLRLVIEGRRKTPNIPEITLFGILAQYFPDEWRFVGDGSVMLDGLNPDFINVNGRKLIIEVFGTYWHAQQGQKYHRTEQGRIEAYEKYGYRTLVIWESEMKDMDTVLGKIIQFVYTKE